MRLGLGLNLNKPSFIESIYGPELIGDRFMDGNGFWILEGGTTISGGLGIVTSSGGSTRFKAQGVMEVGKTYKLEFDVVSTNGYNLGNVDGGLRYGTTSVGRSVTTFVADYVDLSIKGYDASVNVTIDNVSLREYIEEEFKNNPIITMSVGSVTLPSSPYNNLTDSHLLNDSKEDAYCQGGWHLDNSYADLIQRQFPVVPDANGNIPPYSCRGWKASFRVSGAFSFRMDGDDGLLSAYLIEVNGRKLYPNNDNGVGVGRRWLTIDAGYGTHSVKVVGLGNSRWSGYVTESGATAEPWNVDRTTIIFGDSFTASSVADKTWNGYVFKLGLSNNHNICPSGAGGIGYVAANSNAGKLKDWIVETYNKIAIDNGIPDEIIIAMGVNDLGQAGIENDANDAFDNLRTVYPGKVYALSPFDGNAPSAPSANFEAARDAIQSAVGTRELFSFIDLEGVSYTKGDAVHPDTEGHLKLGKYIGGVLVASPDSFGEELVSNGVLNDASNWNTPGGWSISGGVASNDGTNDHQLSQSGLPIVTGNRYLVSFQVKNITSGVVAASIGVALASVPNKIQVGSNGVHSAIIEAQGDDRIYFYPQGGFIGSIDNVSVKEVLT